MAQFMNENVFKNTDNSDLELFEIGETVQLHSLKKKSWNNKLAVIIAPYLIKNGVKRWPIKLKNNPSQKASIKEANMRLMGNVEVIYEAKLSDPVDMNVNKTFTFKNSISKQRLAQLRSNAHQSKQFMLDTFKKHRREMLHWYKWHCTQCQQLATRIQPHPMSYLNLKQPMIMDLAGTTCDSKVCIMTHNEMHHQMMMEVTNNAKGYQKV
eukprot:230293_1